MAKQIDIVNEFYERIIDVIKDDFDANSMYEFIDDEDFENNIKDKIREVIAIVVEEFVDSGDIKADD